jgi:hypothetical protein
MLSFSEQKLIDFSSNVTYNNGCTRGSMTSAFNYVRDNKGIYNRTAYRMVRSFSFINLEACQKFHVKMTLIRLHMWFLFEPTTGKAFYVMHNSWGPNWGEKETFA